jgi:hypothetical protein
VEDDNPFSAEFTFVASNFPSKPIRIPVRYGVTATTDSLSVPVLPPNVSYGEETFRFKDSDINQNVPNARA